MFRGRYVRHDRALPDRRTLLAGPASPPAAYFTDAFHPARQAFQPAHDVGKALAYAGPGRCGPGSKRRRNRGRFQKLATARGVYLRGPDGVLANAFQWNSRAATAESRSN